MFTVAHAALHYYPVTIGPHEAFVRLVAAKSVPDSTQRSCGMVFAIAPSEGRCIRSLEKHELYS
jgi:hypothetical protein